MLNSDIRGAKYPAGAEPLDFLYRSLQQANTFRIRLEAQRARQGLRAAPQFGGFGVGVLPITDPGQPDSAAVACGQVRKRVGGIEILAIVGPQFLLGGTFPGEPEAVEIADEILDARTTGGRARIAVDDQHPLLAPGLIV